MSNTTHQEPQMDNTKNPTPSYRVLEDLGGTLYLVVWDTAWNVIHCQDYQPINGDELVDAIAALPDAPYDDGDTAAAAYKALTAEPLGYNVIVDDGDYFYDKMGQAGMEVFGEGPLAVEIDQDDLIVDGEAVALITIDPEARTVTSGVSDGVYTEAADKGVVINVPVSSCVRAANLEGVISDYQDYLQGICDGHATKWNGHNFIGTLTGEAQAMLTRFRWVCANFDARDCCYTAREIEDTLEVDTDNLEAATNDELPALITKLTKSLDENHQRRVLRSQVEIFVNRIRS